MAEGKVDVSHAQMSFGQKIGSAGISTGINLGANFLNGMVNDFWNRRAEKRADERTRRWTEDQYKHMVDGRRKAGLNPYDVDGADAPSMAGTSTTDTNSGVNAMQDMALAQQMKNDTMVAESTAYRNYAEGTALLNKDNREDDAHTLNMKKLLATVESQELQNRILAVDAELAEYRKPNLMALSNYELQKAQLGIQEQIANILNTTADTELKYAEVEKLMYESAYLEMQTRLAESGIEVNLATVSKIYSDIALNGMQSQYLVALTEKTNVEKLKAVEEISKIQNESALVLEDINLRRSQVKTEKVKRNYMRNTVATQYMNAVSNMGSAAVDIVGAIATKGASAAAGGSTLVYPNMPKAVPPGIYDSFGNPL